MTLTPTQRQLLEANIEKAELIEQAKLLRPSLWYPPHAGQLAFHQAPHTIRAMFPGNGFGKTRAAGTEANWWLTHVHPYQKTPAWPIIAMWGCESYKQFDILRAQLESECFDRGWTFNGSDNRYEWPGGDRLYLISYDADWTNIQGINPDLMIFDEEPPPKLWRESRMRRRGRRKTRYVFAMTATKGMTWVHEEIYAPWLKHHADHGLTEDGAIEAQTHPAIWCLPRGGIDDNPGADASDRAWYRSHKYNSEAERLTRLFGGIRDFAGTPVFDEEGLERQRPNLIEGEHGHLVRRAKQTEGEPEEWDWEGDGPGDRGRVTIFEHPNREKLPGGKLGRFLDAYVFGHDSAYGLAEGDFDYAVGFSRNTGRQVAEAQGRWGDVQWAEILRGLYWYYGEAFLLGERQVGLPTMRRLYDEMGVRYQFFDRDDASAGRRHSDKLGHFRRAGDLTISRMRRALGARDGHGVLLPAEVTIRSRELFRQLCRYQFRPRSTTKDMNEVHDVDLATGATPGDHDDGVMGGAYGVMALAEVSRFPEPERPKFAATAAGAMLDHESVFEPVEEE